MKWHLTVARLGFASLLCFCIISAKNYADINVKTVAFESIEDLVSDHKLEVQIYGLGGHQEECIEFYVSNISSDTLNLLIEPGRRLTSVDSTLQDILIVKQKKIVLLPFEKRTISGNGFCCQSSHGGPRKDSEFRLGYLAPKSWLTLAKVIDENKFPTGAIQSAIWVLSNDHPLSSIHHDNMEDILLLRQTVADIKGIALPWYTLIYEADTSTIFSGRPEKIIADLKYQLKTNSVVTINIRDKYGNIIFTPMQKSAPGRGQHSYHLNLLVQGWPKGEYELYIYEDYHNLNTKKTFKI